MSQGREGCDFFKFRIPELLLFFFNGSVPAVPGQGGMQKMCNSKHLRSSWILQLFLIKTHWKPSVVPWEDEGHLLWEADTGIPSKVRAGSGQVPTATASPSLGSSNLRLLAWLHGSCKDLDPSLTLLTPRLQRGGS